MDARVWIKVGCIELTSRVCVKRGLVASLVMNAFNDVDFATGWPV